VIEPHGDAAGSVTCPNGLTRRSPPTRLRDLRGGLSWMPAAGVVAYHQDWRALTLHPLDAITRAHYSAPGPGVSDRPTPAPAHGRALAVLAGRRREPAAAASALNRTISWLHHRVRGPQLRRLLSLGLTRTASTWTPPSPTRPHPRPSLTIPPCPTVLTNPPRARPSYRRQCELVSRSSGTADPHAAQGLEDLPVTHTHRCLFPELS